MRERRVNSDTEVIEEMQGKVVRQLVKTARTGEQVRKIAQIIQFCRRKGAKVPEVVRVEGRFLTTRFVKGETYRGSRTQLQSVAKELAVLHQCLSACRIVYHYDPGARGYAIGEWKQKKEQLIHHDMQPGNVLFFREEVTAILDFGGMRKGEVLQDIAFAAFRFGRSKQNIQLFVKTYLATNDIGRIDFSQIKEYFIYETLRRIHSLKASKDWALRSEARAQELKKQKSFLKMAYEL